MTEPTREQEAKLDDLAGLYGAVSVLPSSEVQGYLDVVCWEHVGPGRLPALAHRSEPARKEMDSMPSSEWSVRVTVVCEEGVSRRRAEQIARSIQRYAEARPGVRNAYEVDVYDLDALVGPDDD